MEDTCEGFVVETFNVVGFVGDLFDMLWPGKFQVNNYTKVLGMAYFMDNLVV